MDKLDGYCQIKNWPFDFSINDSIFLFSIGVNEMGE